MANITHKGNTIHTIGNLPKVGNKAPDFLLTKNDLSNVTLANYQGKKKILNIVPSLDTGVCAASARMFEKEIASIPNAVVLTISCDLPFAQKRFCQTENITNVETLSAMRTRNFSKDYGVEITDGVLAGLMSRAVVILDENNVVTYTEQVPEIAQEPNYQAALSAVR